MRDGVVVAVENVATALTVAPRAGASLQLRDLERAIRLLPEEQRQVILLVALEGMRYEEVAAVLDIPIGTVRSRLSRGREMLPSLDGHEGGAGRNLRAPARASKLRLSTPSGVTVSL